MSVEGQHEDLTFLGQTKAYPTATFETTGSISVIIPAEVCRICASRT